MRRRYARRRSIVRRYVRRRSIVRRRYVRRRSIVRRRYVRRRSIVRRRYVRRRSIVRRRYVRRRLTGRRYVRRRTVRVRRPYVRRRIRRPTYTGSKLLFTITVLLFCHYCTFLHWNNFYAIQWCILQSSLQYCTLFRMQVEVKLILRRNMKGNERIIAMCNGRVQVIPVVV